MAESQQQKNWMTAQGPAKFKLLTDNGAGAMHAYLQILMAQTKSPAEATATNAEDALKALRAWQAVAASIDNLFALRFANPPAASAWHNAVAQECGLRKLAIRALHKLPSGKSKVSAVGRRRTESRR